MHKLMLIVSLLALGGAVLASAAQPQATAWMSPATTFEPTFHLATLLDQGYCAYLPDTFHCYVITLDTSGHDTFLLATKFHPMDFVDPLLYHFGYPLYVLGLSALFFNDTTTTSLYHWDNDQFKFIIFANDGKTVLHTSDQQTALQNSQISNDGWTNYLLPDSVLVSSGDFWVAIQKIGTRGHPNLGYVAGAQYWKGHSYYRDRLWGLINKLQGFNVLGEGCIEALVDYHPTAVGEQSSSARPLVLDLGASPAHNRVEVRYTLPEAGFASLVVYDVTGRTVATLVSQQQEIGVHAVVWNGTDRTGTKVPNGAYLCRLSAGGTSVVKKVLLVQ